MDKIASSYMLIDDKDVKLNLLKDGSYSCETENEVFHGSYSEIMNYLGLEVK